jgi:hypothetical protein
MELLINGLKDAGVCVSVETLKKAVDLHGEDYVSLIVSRFKTSRSKLAGGQLTGKIGGSAEKIYSKDFQKLVSIGLGVQLKKKYR